MKSSVKNSKNVTLLIVKARSKVHLRNFTLQMNLEEEAGRELECFSRKKLQIPQNMMFLMNLEYILKLSQNT